MCKIELTEEELQELLFVLDDVNIESAYDFSKQKDNLIPVVKQAIKKLWTGAVDNNIADKKLIPEYLLNHEN